MWSSAQKQAECFFLGRCSPCAWKCLIRFIAIDSYKLFKVHKSECRACFWSFCKSCVPLMSEDTRGMQAGVKTVGVALESRAAGSMLRYFWNGHQGKDCKWTELRGNKEAVIWTAAGRRWVKVERWLIDLTLGKKMCFSVIFPRDAHFRNKELICAALEGWDGQHHGFHQALPLVLGTCYLLPRCLLPPFLSLWIQLTNRSRDFCTFCCKKTPRASLKSVIRT